MNTKEWCFPSVFTNSLESTHGLLGRIFAPQVKLCGWAFLPAYPISGCSLRCSPFPSTLTFWQCLFECIRFFLSQRLYTCCLCCLERPFSLHLLPCSSYLSLTRSKFPWCPRLDVIFPGFPSTKLSPLLLWYLSQFTIDRQTNRHVNKCTPTRKGSKLRGDSDHV